MKNSLSLLMSIAVTGSMVSCTTTPDLSATGAASGISDVAGVANSANSVRNLVGDSDSDNKLSRSLGTAQFGSGLLSGLKKPEVPGTPGIPATPEAPKLPGLPSLSDLPGFGVKTPTPIEVEMGMSQDELTAAAGRPAYKYTLNNQETWVYENTSFVAKTIKKTAMGMVPGLGSATTLLSTIGGGGKPQLARAAVSFDQEGTVKYFTQCDPPVAFAVTKK